VEQKGFALPPRPRKTDKYQDLPDNITEISSEELGERYAAMVAWWAYAEAKLGLSQARLVETARNVSSRETSLLAQCTSKEKWRFEKYLWTDEIWLTLTSDRDKDLAYHNLLQQLAKRYEKFASCLSREITRRGIAFDA